MTTVFQDYELGNGEEEGGLKRPLK